MHSRHSLRLLAPLALLALSVGSMRAQQFLSPLTSNEGTGTAARQAKIDLGDDAYLYFIGTLGNLDFQGQKVEFDPNNGKATAWGYSFYSPTSTQIKTYFVVKVPLLGTQIVPLNTGDTAQQTSLPVAPNALDSSASWFGSGAMVARLKGQETLYSNYLQQFPNARPGFVTLGQIAGDSTPPPQGLPLDQPIWTIVFGGGGDSSIICFVASKTGETNCQQIQAPIGEVPVADATARTGSIRVLPQPGSNRFLLELEIPEGRSTENFRAGLYSLDGRRVADLTNNFAGGESRAAILETEKFSAGKYLIVVTAGNWRAVSGVVVYGS